MAEDKPISVVVIGASGIPSESGIRLDDTGVRTNSSEELDRTNRVLGETDTIERLGHELHGTREKLRVTIEEYEAAIAELGSSSDEVQFINEEMKATNDELRTLKAELQFAHQSLQTVNSELNAQILEADRANSDLKNLLVEAEKQREALVHELDHRIRNILAIVSAIAKQTLAKSHSLEEFKDAFSSRLQSIVRSYGLVSREHWTDVKLHDILAGAFAAVLSETEAKRRLTLKGPPVAFKPAAALSLGLITHELVANAAKHGAISMPKGKVAVNWGIASSPRKSLVVRWVESPGRKIGKPNTKGLGMELIERELKGALGATVKFSYKPQGLSARIAIPMDSDRVTALSK